MKTASYICNYLFTGHRGVARIFQRGGHTVSNIIVLAFSPRNIVGCLLKKRLTKGGHGQPRTPPPPRYALGAWSWVKPGIHFAYLYFV